MKISPSSMTAEHWLTLMTCTICEKTPDDSPVYKCNYGHTMCYPCFLNIAKNKTVPVCNLCGSDNFTRMDVSKDFLHKLKTKPGIGRPCRYVLEEMKPRTPPLPEEPQTPPMTLEELFQLSTSQLKELFDECTKEKMQFLNSFSSTERLTGRMPTLSSQQFRPSSSSDKEIPIRHLLRKEESQSRRPLKCPHYTCSKIVAISSFKSHFKYDHFDFIRYKLLRASEMAIPFDPSVIEHGRSVCIGIIHLYPNDEEEAQTQNCEIDTFWIMVSGSIYENSHRAYVLFWIFTNNDAAPYHCTMELSSQNNMMTMTTLHKVNSIYDSQSINEVAAKLNCLYITFNTMTSMLVYGSEMNLRLKIH